MQAHRKDTIFSMRRKSLRLDLWAGFDSYRLRNLKQLLNGNIECVLGHGFRHRGEVALDAAPNEVDGIGSDDAL
jgi:hypothetical protein